MNALEKLINWAPSQSGLARLLGVTPQAIDGWKRRGQIPAERVLDIERVTDGAFSRHELRPDLYGERPRSDRRVVERRSAERRQGDRRV